jgi:hypothetical protein
MSISWPETISCTVRGETRNAAASSSFVRSRSEAEKITSPTGPGPSRFSFGTPHSEFCPCFTPFPEITENAPKAVENS